MRSKAALLTLASTVLIGASVPATPTFQGARTYTAWLTPPAEADKFRAPRLEGDMDGSGLVKLNVDLDARQVCYSFALSNLATPLMAHIHKGSALRTGPSVVTLFTGPGGDLDGCVLWTEKWLAEIVSNPSNYYVSLYTTEYPDGALRGQLTS